MTDLEKIDARITAVDEAIAAVRSAMTVDRKLGHDKHPSGHFTRALTELTSIQAQLNALRVRMDTVGR